MLRTCQNVLSGDPVLTFIVGGAGWASANEAKASDASKGPNTFESITSIRPSFDNERETNDLLH